MTRTLPAGSCIGHAISSVRNNIAYAFRIAWPWYAFLVPVNIVASFVISHFQGGNPEAPSVGAFFVYLALILLNLLAFASIAVNWHRYILLDEVPGAHEIFRLDDKVRRYFGNVLLIFLIVLAASLAVTAPLAALVAYVNALAFPAVLAIAVGIFFIATIFFRLSVKLPAIALGRVDFGLGAAWTATRGNALPLFLIALFEVAAALAVLLALLLVTYVFSTISFALAVVVSSVLQVVINWIFSIFGITVLTSLYGFFVEGRDF